MKKLPRKDVVVEELCMDSDCKRGDDTHWHPFDLEALVKEIDLPKRGNITCAELTVTLRVRRVGK